MSKPFLISVALILSITTLFAQEQKDDYHFDQNGISRTVLENYLNRSITFTDLLPPPGFENDGAFSGKEDDLRLVKNIRPKFIGRSIYRWGKEDTLADRRFLDGAKQIATKIHEFDPDILLQACLFEIVTKKVNDVSIPGWVFEAFGLPKEERNFQYDKMLAPNGKFVDLWGRDTCVPDITQQETKLWFLFLLGTYMDIGCEAFHLGQVELIGMNDPKREHWVQFIDRLREFSAKRARRGWLLLDAHTPHGGMVVDGKSLLDFNSFPLRIKEIPENPRDAKLEVGYLDALFCRSTGCVTPSGWKCDSLPYLVEFDNFGISRTPGQSTVDVHYIWGYDEISWFYLQPEEYRQNWVKYADNWVRENDKNGFLQMPIGRCISTGRGQRERFRANTPSDAVPEGMNLEETIKVIFESKNLK